MSSPLFSVLIAQYNNGQYLQQAIDSVKAQTYTHWEIILVDDGSTDHSKELYKLYEQEEQIKIYYNPKNEGCGYTKRKCIELANGELCGFLDPDDALLPDALALMVEKHIENDSASLVHSKFIYCDENLKEKAIFHYAKEITGSDYLHNNTWSIGHFVSFKKKLYDKTERINAEIIRAVDQDLYLKLEEVGPLCFIDKPLYLYRVHANGISQATNATKALFQLIKVIELACKRRNIADEAEVIAGNLIYTNHINHPYTSLADRVDHPTFRFVLRIIYNYIRKK
jgi:glycosyltransferase involved in cell wall biosynthesis